MYCLHLELSCQDLKRKYKNYFLHISRSCLCKIFKGIHFKKCKLDIPCHMIVLYSTRLRDFIVQFMIFIFFHSVYCLLKWSVFCRVFLVMPVFRESFLESLVIYSATFIKWMKILSSISRWDSFRLLQKFFNLKFELCNLF